MTKSFIVIIGLLMIIGTPVRADDTPDPAEQPLWEFKLVGFGQSFPAYPSSTDQNLTLLPLPVPVYHGRFLRFGESLEDLAESRLLRSDRVDLSLSVSAEFPADSNDVTGRQGMPDLDFLLEGGPEVRFRLGGGKDDNRELNLSLQLRAAVSTDGQDTRGRGFVLNPELEYLARDLYGSRNEWRLRISTTWATSDFMDFSYGVAPEFATPERPAYAATSGYLNTEVLVGLNRKITDRLEFRGSLRLWVNKGGANEESPLYQQDVNTGIRLALFWTAWQSTPK